MNYAIIKNNIVSNIIIMEQPYLVKNTIPAPPNVQIGDIYKNGNFYRDGILVKDEDVRSRLVEDFNDAVKALEKLGYK